MTRRVAQPKRSRPRRGQPEWARWPAKRLLELRICDLGLRIEGTPLEARIAQLHEELCNRGLRIKPHFWLSDEWFTPEGATGTAIPFYLAHPRLIRLQRSRGEEVEGTNHDWCMKILRHEAGHVVDHAFRLNRRRKRQQLFGLSSKNYPRSYRPNPYSRRHVQHLYYWYAQSHPDEDFAETFAVWLAPRSRWRTRYQGWAALKKLEYMNELMAELTDQRPQVRTRAQVDPLRKLKLTLGEHYDQLQDGPASLYPAFYDYDLLRLFTPQRGRGRVSAAAFIRRAQSEIKKIIGRWLGEQRYQLDHVLQEMIGRCRELKLYLRGSERAARLDVAILLTKHTMDSLYRHRRWVDL